MTTSGDGEKKNQRGVNAVEKEVETDLREAVTASSGETVGVAKGLDIWRRHGTSSTVSTKIYISGTKM